MERTTDRLQQALDAITDGYYSLDREWRFVEVSQAAARHFGAPARQLIGRNVWDVTGVGPGTDIYDRFHEAAGGDRPVRFEAVSQLRRGDWYEFHLLPHADVLDVFFRLITDRKRVENALRDREAELRQERGFLRAVVDAVSSMVTVRDARGHCLLANEAAARFHGMTVGALEGRDCHDVATVPAESFAMDRKVLESGRDSVEEIEAAGADGQRRFLITSRTPLVGPNGLRDRVLWTAVDITWRKRAEHAVRDSEERLRSILENMSEGLMLFDATGTLLYQNPASLRIHGFRADEDRPAKRERIAAQWRGWDENGRPLGVEEWPMSRVLREGPFEHQVLRAQRTDTGHEFYASYNGCPLYDSDGKLAFGFITIRDITEEVQAERARTRAENALRESEARLRRLYESGMIGVCYFDLGGAITDANDKFLAMVGYTREDLLADRISWAEMTPPEYQAVDAAAVEELRTKGVETPYEKEFIRKDASRVAVLVGAALFDDAHRHGLAFVLDITDRKRADVALREANERLAEADRRKDEFIAILSHELRNPIAPVRYALPLLQRERLTERGQRAVQVVDRQVAHLTRLVDDLLDVSRITRGKIELRREEVTLGSIVSAAAEAAAPAITAARHSLEMAIPDEPIWVQVDAARIAQVVTNLLNNSAKYTPRGGRITVEAARENGNAVIKVQDNGIGIPPDALPTIFEMFRQVNRPDRSQGGLGIGLALVKLLVEMHGGTIGAHSAGSGHGAEFIVRLPLLATVKPGEVGQAVGEVPASGRRLKVLVVDDNADLVEMLAILVEAAGHDVRKALDGRTALSAAGSYRPDVVLLDLGLPVIGGLDVARELRRRPETANAQLVALTGWGQAEDRRQTKEAGFDHHLTKPADPEQLNRLLAQFAEARR